MPLTPFRRALPYLAIALTVGIGTVFLAETLYGRHESTLLAQRNGRNLSNTIEENIRRTLDFYDRSLVGVIEELGDSSTMALAPGVRNRVLFDKAITTTGVSQVYVIDAEGVIRISSVTLTPIPNSLADRSYFQAHRNNPDVGLYISEPIVSRFDGQPSVVVSRRLKDKDGAFQGVVAATIGTEYLSDLFNQINLGDDGRITLTRTDGTIISRFPYDKSLIGRDLSKSPVMGHFLKTGEDFFSERSTIDGEERLYRFKKFEGYPLTIVVAQAANVVYADWMRRSWLMGSLTLVMMLGCLGLGRLFVRELDARQRTTEQLHDAEQDMRTILHGLPAMVAYWDRRLRIRFANNSYLESFADTPEPPPVRPGDTALPSDTEGLRLAGANAHHLHRALQGEARAFETPLIDGNNAQRHVMVSFVPDRVEGSTEVRGVFVQATDITERKLAEDRLLEEKERFRVTLASIGDAVVSTDAQGRITYLNPVAERITSWTSADAMGLPVEYVVPLREGAFDGPDRSPIRNALESGEGVIASASGTLLNRHRVRFDVEDSAAPIKDAQGTVVGAVMVLRDVTQARAMALRMAYLAQHDALTGLPNRVLLVDRATQAIAQAVREGTGLAVMYMDLDHFKNINDSMGHRAGDELLVAFAERISRALRQTDTLSRQGGDEFVVLASLGHDPNGGNVLAGELVRLCAEPFVVEGRRLQVGTSVGVALFPHHGRSFEELARHADIAMYAAKRAGRSRFTVFDAALEMQQPGEPVGI
ncbi:diguanylate cyclase domain-containing protein [Xylophilus sp. Leaf220]|uniref:bifunctional diguanylate cyclase/phosphodiesterase n=1 Tax=Xylophilus sp. Leaf220 TaxID=1735686 RepID=UPI0007010C39|nr:diguanylate cyclase [Xylophilus sp. Leaf220]KQM68351.1 hypothetical protein ASE76_15070 [Xylophilus sp. Leaf220]